MIEQQAKLAWAFDNPQATLTIYLQKESDKESLGIKASLPRQIELEYEGLQPLSVSEPYIRVDGVKVRGV